MLIGIVSLRLCHVDNHHLIEHPLTVRDLPVKHTKHRIFNIGRIPRNLEGFWNANTGPSGIWKSANVDQNTQSYFMKIYRIGGAVRDKISISNVSGRQPSQSQGRLGPNLAD